MLIRARQHVASDPPRPPRQGVAKNARDRRVQNRIAVLLPHPVERPVARRVELPRRPSKPFRIVPDATTVDGPSLPEVPRQLVPGIKAQRHGHLLTRGGLEDVGGLTQMSRDEQAEFPFRKRAEQLGVSIDEGPKVNRRLSVDQAPQADCSRLPDTLVTGLCQDVDRICALD